ncbi:hypothetical protein GSH05_05280 [Burkholderia pseudomallei]|nr:hypothetical protein [Burkholderia pseudomallei]
MPAPLENATDIHRHPPRRDRQQAYQTYRSRWVPREVRGGDSTRGGRETRDRSGIRRPSRRLTRPRAAHEPSCGSPRHAAAPQLGRRRTPRPRGRPTGRWLIAARVLYCFLPDDSRAARRRRASPRDRASECRFPRNVESRRRRRPTLE